MISEALVFLQRHLGRALQSDPQEAEDRVVLPDGAIPRDGWVLKETAVSLLLLSIEEETTLRPGDPYLRVAANGSRQRVYPDIRLNLNVLFVPSFQAYADSLGYLSRIIGHFQAHRVLNHANAPELDPGIDQLIFELRTPTFSELNEIWGALRLPCRPSVLYRVRMVVFQAPDRPTAPPVSESTVLVHERHTKRSPS